MDPNAPQQPMAPEPPQQPLSPEPVQQPTNPAVPLSSPEPTFTPTPVASDHFSGPPTANSMQPTAGSAPVSPANAMPTPASPGKSKMIGILLIVFGIIVLVALGFLAYTAFLK